MRNKLDACASLIATGCAEEAIAILTEILSEIEPGCIDEAMALDLLGKANCSLGKLDDGLKAFTASCDLVRVIHAQGGIGTHILIRSLQNLAHAQAVADNYTKAKAVADEAADMALAKWGESSPQYAECLFHLSEPAYLQRDLSLAETLLGKAASIWAAQETPGEMYGACLNNLGRVCEEKDDLEAGVEWHRKAVAYRRKLPKREDLAFSLGNYGLALASIGELAAAIASLRESDAVYASIGKTDCKDAIGFRRNLQILKHAAREKI